MMSLTAQQVAQILTPEQKQFIRHASQRMFPAPSWKDDNWKHLQTLMSYDVLAWGGAHNTSLYLTDFGAEVHTIIESK
jgi:hypothetical protein